MSVVVAIKDKDRVWVGCDSQGTVGGNKITLTGIRKIWKPSDSNNIIMGVVGTVRDIGILSTTEKWIDELTELKNEFNYKYMVRTVVPKIFNELNTYGRMRTDNGIQSIESSVTFAYQDKAYLVYRSGCVIEAEDIVASGSGSVSSLGAWNGIKDNKDMSIRDKLIECVKAGCDNNLYVNYPIIIMNTLDDKIEIIEK